MEFVRQLSDYLGGAAGGAIALILILALILYFLLKRSKQRKRESATSATPFFDDKHLSHNTATSYGSPATVDTAVMAPYGPDAYGRPASYEHGDANGHAAQASGPAAYQPYRPLPPELPDDPVTRYELPAQ